MKKNNLSLFIFRRDLRLYDNTALISALQNSNVVLPCFIFDPLQIGDNPYKSHNCVQFMLESLNDLDDNLRAQKGRLFYFYGTAENIVRDILAHLPVEAVYVNRDYTPFSILRDEHIQKECQSAGRSFYSFSDALLTEPEDVSTQKNRPYTVFSRFKSAAQYKKITDPNPNPHTNYYTAECRLEDPHFAETLCASSNTSLYPRGGRKTALRILATLERFGNYEEERNFPALNGTTGLSAHNKFGTCSIREVYHQIKQCFGTTHTLIQELYWRDFFTHIGFHFPHVLKGAFHEKYNGLSWNTNGKDFERWKTGRTGFPLVDAGMRQLNSTGFMHNRVRMVAASFLVKDLHINWQWGEQYFAQQLVDYDPLVNNGNWQWAASTGCDAQPYFRIFNPWLQQKKFDPDCLYIKQWIPELDPLPPSEIHHLHTVHSLPLGIYPAPMCDHKKESLLSKNYFKQCG